MESFSENEGLLKHGATVVIKLNDNQKKQARKNRSRFVIGEESEEKKKKIVQFLKPQDFGEIDLSLE